jgi:hypothetical protein
MWTFGIGGVLLSEDARVETANDSKSSSQSVVGEKKMRSEKSSQYILRKLHELFL